jgi:aerobic carbon-monoxide dehydrogenase large subunit
MSILGTRVIRTEDPRLLTVGGVYVDDLRTPELDGAARVTFVRSPVAHARITGIDISAASQEPGVAAVQQSTQCLIQREPQDRKASNQ